MIALCLDCKAFLNVRHPPPQKKKKRVSKMNNSSTCKHSGCEPQSGQCFRSNNDWKAANLDGSDTSVTH